MKRGTAHFISLPVVDAETEGEGGQPTMLDVIIAYPDSMHLDTQTPQGQLTIVANSTSAYMSMGDTGTRSMSPAQREEMMSQIHHDLLYIAQHADDASFTFTAAGTEKVGDTDAAVVDIGGAVPWIRWYVDPNSGRVLIEKYKATGPNGPFDGETELSDWRTADGITEPYLHKNKQNGQFTSSVEYKKIDLNPTIDPKLFEKPAASEKK